MRFLYSRTCWLLSQPMDLNTDINTDHTCACAYVRMYELMCVCVYVGILWVHVVHTSVCVCVCIHMCMHLVHSCMYVCVHECINVGTYVCVYVCIMYLTKHWTLFEAASIYVCISIHIQIPANTCTCIDTWLCLVLINIIQYIYTQYLALYTE